LGFWDEINWDFGHEIHKKKHYDFGENKNRLFYLFSREDKHSNKRQRIGSINQMFMDGA
jgi:hypothetical protein